jgi:hypothetical protein
MWLCVLPLMGAGETPFAERTQALYARRDVDALRAACTGARGEADLLCRYRLYPLTQHEALLDLPEQPPVRTARAYALLAGLWGYRAARAPLVRMPAYGRRTMDLLRHARALDPGEPFALLVEGQSLLFRPALFGGDRQAALRLFRRLRVNLATHPGSGIAPLEADLWIWYTRDRLGDPGAPALRARLLEGAPPLYRDFLLHPPG